MMEKVLKEQWAYTPFGVLRGFRSRGILWVAMNKSGQFRIEIQAIARRRLRLLGLGNVI